jgi:hypothetical protein
MAELKGEAYNGDAVVVDVCAGVQFLLELSVLDVRPGEERDVSLAVFERDKRLQMLSNGTAECATHWTPAGWSAVWLTGSLVGSGTAVDIVMSGDLIAFSNGGTKTQ